MSQRFRVRVLPGVLGYLPGRQLRGPEGLVGGTGLETLGIKKKKKKKNSILKPNHGFNFNFNYSLVVSNINFLFNFNPLGVGLFVYLVLFFEIKEVQKVCSIVEKFYSIIWCYYLF